MTPGAAILICRPFRARRWPLLTAAQAPCTGSDDLLTQFGGNSGLGGRVRQPNLNFAPQFGLAWDPGKNGQTVIRAGIGMYYDNNVFRNLLGDRVARLANGQFNAQANDPCASHGVVIFPGNVAQSAAGLCGQPIGNVATADGGSADCFPGGQCRADFRVLPIPASWDSR